MNAESKTLCREVNRNINELNTYLVEANVEPVSELSVKSLDTDNTSLHQLRETLDYLEVPLYADSRIDPVLHKILKQLALLDEINQ